MARINLTKSAAQSEAGASLIKLLISIIEDGQISDREIKELKTWLGSADFPDDIPAFSYLHSLVKSILKDGKIAHIERLELLMAIQRILPKNQRDAYQSQLDVIKRECDDALSAQSAELSRRANMATDRQLAFIRNLGGDASREMSITEASDYIEDLLAQQKNRPSPRQIMVLRFWNKLNLKNQPSEAISDWMNQWYSEDPKRRAAWELWKEEHGDQGDRWNPDVNKVKVGIGYQYLKRVGGKGTGKGCGPLIFFLFLLFLIFMFLLGS